MVNLKTSRAFFYFMNNLSFKKKVRLKRIMFQQRFITVEEAAKYLNVPKTKMYEYVKSKGFPSLKHGKAWRVDTEKLNAWIDKQIENKMAVC